VIASLVGTIDAFLGRYMKTNGILKGKFVLLLGIGCAVLLASATDANANRIPLPPSINLTIGDQHELGLVQPPTPEGDADITQYVNFMIGLSLGGSGHVIIGPHNILVTRSMNNFGSLPGPATLALRGTGTTINLGIQGTYSYLFAHYGGPGGGFAEVWYVGDLSGTISIPATGLGHGLSGWALFTAPGGAVPDGGTTAMLLGAALSMLGLVRRFFIG
jgi:protein with PEP-CTERM/exosortase system signal